MRSSAPTSRARPRAPSPRGPAPLARHAADAEGAPLELVPALDPALCERARMARDARFDGRFFIGVVTTGVYCRPICPVRQPKSQNVRFYASAAAAAEAGFRPCLRCRPESAPGTGAWLGTAATVSRALRLIQGGALDEAGVEALAARLGIGARHLGRLFLRHLGATPVAVAQTRRLHLAKKLLDETVLPMTEIAHAAGYGSVRRFNESLRATYGRAPSALRKLRGGALPPRGASARAAAGAALRAECSIRLRLAYRPPFAWRALLGFLERRAIPGVEVVSGGSYGRSLALEGRVGWLAVRPLAQTNHLELAVALPDPGPALVALLARVRRVFDLDADSATIERDLGRDPALAPLLRAQRGLRVPGAFDGFELAVRAILGQGVTVAGARTLAGRLVARFGRPLPPDAAGPGLTHAFPGADVLARADLAGLGLLPARATAIQLLAREVARGALDLETSPGLDAFVASFTRIPGVADWTAQYVAMRALGEPDAFPASDLGLLRGAQRAFGQRFSAATLARRADPWRPWRSYAAMHLWG